LLNGFPLPPRGAHYKLYGAVPRRGSQFATLELAALLGRAARTVDQHLGGAPLVIADCSSEHGGKLGTHQSHTSGRDVDVLFYALDASGNSVQSPGFVDYDGEGRCQSTRCKVTFDDARNWWFVRVLVASQRPAVQYIFVSDPLRARLLAWAERHGEDPELLRRARRVLLEPDDSSPHADHFHVRVYCTPDDRAAGCVDVGPRWSWLEF
jgi:penicillin-insensitive murein endopeptidase